MEIIEPPRIEQRPEIPTVGIRRVTPFRGMLGVRDGMFAELRAWNAQSELETVGHGYFRLHVIDMQGPMELEVGYATREPHPGGGGVEAGSFPAGRYATLTYQDHAMRANRALIEWADERGVTFDRWDEPAGDRFACRYEAYLTDPKLQPRKTKWHVELNIKVAG